MATVGTLVVWLASHLPRAGVALEGYESWPGLHSGSCGAVVTLGGCQSQMRLPARYGRMGTCQSGEIVEGGFAGECWDRESSARKVDGECQK